LAAQRLRTCWISLTLLTVCASATAAPTTVADVLRTLSSTGVDVLYSSDLVPPTLDAPTTMHEGDPMSRAVEALTAHHLLLRSVGQRRYVVIRAPGARPATPAAPSAQNIPELDEISVFASRYEFTDSAVGEPIAFTRRDIAEVPGAQQDAMRAIRAVPGIATNLSSRPYVRGAFLDDVLVRFDGIPLTDPFHFKNFQSLISAFDPAAVEQVDIYTGGFPVKYGTRSAGVIDLAPRSVQSGYENRIGLSRLSYDLSTVGHAEHLPIEWLATVRHSVHDIVLKPINGDIGEPTFVDALGRVRWQVNDASAWTVGWLLLDDRVKLATDPTTEQAIVRDRDVYTWLAADWALTGALHSRTSLSLTNTERSRSGSLALTGIANGSLNERRDVASTDLRTEWTYIRSAELSWNFGAEAMRESAELSYIRREEFASPIAASFAQPSNASLNARQAPRSATLGLFVSGRRRWQELEAEVGARLDRQDYRGFGARAQLSPRVNLRYDLTPVWQVYGSWGRFTQAQRVGEWRMEENQSTPDPATQAVHLIAGVAHEGAGAARWRLEVYRNHWSSVSPYFDNSLNALSLLPDLRPDRLRIAPGAAEAAGIELSVRRSLGYGFDASAAYALSRTTDDLGGRDIPRSWDQTHALNLDLAWRHANTSASLLVGWHSGWPRTPVSVVQSTPTLPASVAVGLRNSGRWGNYATADLRLAQTVPSSYGELTLWVDTTNLINRGNQCCAGISPAGQTDAAPTIATNNWLSRIINTGFTWRFGPPR
jgi:outer membrane receptor protein involved in Fe transport